MTRQILRDYQAQAIDELRAKIRAGHRSVLLVAPTGSGKTTIAAAMIDGALAKGKRIIFLAHRKELIDQCSARLDGLGVDHGVIMAQHWRRRPGARVHVASVLTLINRELNVPPDLIFIDECHRSRADSYQQVLSRYPEAVCIGLTATPVRSDGRGLGSLFSAMVQCPGLADLTARGYLVPTRVFAPMRVPDLGGVKKSAGDYNLGALGRAMDKQRLTGDIVDHWRRLASDRLTVCFAVTIEHSRHIVAEFRQAGIAAAHLDGETETGERERLLADLAAGRIRVLSNVGVLTEGWDCPAVSCVILARPTMSLGLYLQMAGRTLRPADGKVDALILDHAGCTLQHGFVDDDRDWQLTSDVIKPPKSKIDMGDEIKVCPKCSRVYAADRKTCECSYVFAVRAPRNAMPETVAGELGEASANRERYTAMRIEKRRELWDRWKDEQELRGYKAGYAAAKYKAMFGQWPPRNWETQRRRQQKVAWPS